VQSGATRAGTGRGWIFFNIAAQAKEDAVVRNYAALRSQGLQADATYHQPAALDVRRVTLEDPALDVMTDFRVVRAITVPAGVSMEYAAQRMRANRIHLLLVTDENNAILGLITSTDIEGERPLIQINNRQTRREEITVADVMTPRERLEVIDMADVLRARVGHVVATFKAVGRQHAMVIDRDESGRPVVRGLFSVSQLNRQLGTAIEAFEIARSFAEVETAFVRVAA
jgi:Mg2+/Co2+ transporter CorC